MKALMQKDIESNHGLTLANNASLGALVMSKECVLKSSFPAARRRDMREIMLI
jgi:hypothetical protein